MGLIQMNGKRWQYFIQNFRTGELIRKTKFVYISEFKK